MAAYTESVASAFAQFQLGNLEEAERLCRDVLHNDPDQAQALHLLGVICHRLGQPEVAIDYLSQAVARNPSEPSFYNNFGAILRAVGKPAQATVCLRKAAALKPDLAETHYNLGVALYDQGQCEEAIQCYRKALRLKPKYAQAYNNLGLAYKRQNNLQPALECFAKAIQSNPQRAEAHYNAGLIYLQQGLFKQAIDHFEQAVRLRPPYAEAHCNLGRALQAVGRVRESIASFKAALRHQPHYAEAHNYLGVSLHVAGRLDEALANYGEATRLNPDYAKAYSNRGIVLDVQGRLDEALSSFRTASELSPEDADAAAGLASVHSKQGRFDQAYSTLRPFLERGTKNIDLACVFASLAGRLNRREEAISLLEQILASQDVPFFKKKMLHLSLGKLYDETEQYSLAFSHYERGNALVYSAFDPKKYKVAVNEIIEAYSPDNMARYPRNRIPSNRPIFIIGMPRSGTSLVEQILASHPKVYGAGELEEIQRIVLSLRKTLGSRDGYPRCMSRISDRDLEHAAREYLEGVSNYAPEAERITDKMPQNFLHLGLIELLFPTATVIHCVRSPVDTCLSCYFQSFGRGHDYSCSLEHLGVYYCEYERLMNHWREVLQIPIHEVRYEELVANTEIVSRRMVGFCGLEWNENCMRFYETERDVKTVSYEQVRRPIYKTAVGRSKHYWQYLGPLLKALQRSEAGCE